MSDSSSYFDTFLSHNSKDKPAVELIAVLLQKQGLQPFLDKWNLVPGEPIEDGLIRALENSGCAVIFTGPAGDGPWQSEEMRDILGRAVKSRNEFRAIPVILPGGSAKAFEKSFLGSRLWIEFKTEDDSDALTRLAKAIKGEAAGAQSLTLPDEPAPYRGLERYERIDKPELDFFFGRDDEIRTLVKRLVKERFIAVVGASGSGKSSLIRAGLSKQLAEQIEPGIRRWITITVDPGSTPFRSLAVQVAVAAGIPVADREDWLEKTVAKWSAQPDALRQTVEVLFADAKEPLLVFIDQFEELFTHRGTSADNDAFTRHFVSSLRDLWQHGKNVRVAIAMRADFIARSIAIAPLKELLQDHTMLVGEVGDDALREIVKEPAARVGAFLEKGLMERILKDVRSGSGSLPLLQQALHGLWKNRTGAWLTHDAYTAAGGVARALNDQAQGAYASLDDAQKTIADQLFPRLITLGEGVADTRRRVQRHELYSADADASTIDAVIDKLSGKDARVLVASQDSVEFTHEALLGNWQHLIALLDRERGSIRKHRAITADAAEWQAKPESERPKFLLREGQLVIAEEWAKTEGGYARLNKTERQFLDDSIAERTAEEQRKARTARRLKILGIGASAAAVIALGFGGFALQQKTKADAETKKVEAANATNLRTLHEASMADFAVAAQRIDKENKWTEGVAHLVRALKWEPENALAATRLYSTLLLSADKRTWPELNVRGLGKARVLLNRPETRMFIIDSRSAQLFDVVKNKPIGERMRFSQEDAHYRDCAQFSPDGARVLVISQGRIHLINANTGEAIGEPIQASDWIVHADFSGSSTRFLVISQTTLQIRDAETGKAAGAPISHMSGPSRLNYEGSRIVSVDSASKTAQVWDALTGKPLGGALKHELTKIKSAEFSPDGSRVMTIADSDPSVCIWDAQTGKLLGKTLSDGVLLGETIRAHFSPDGSRILTMSGESIRIWDGSTCSAVCGPIPCEFYGDASFSPEGGRIVAWGSFKKTQIWDAVTGSALGRPIEATGPAIFTPDGSRIVTTHEDSSRVWDAATGSPIGESLPISATDAVFTRNLGMFVNGQFWDLPSDKPVGEVVLNLPRGPVHADEGLGFSPDCSLIISGLHTHTSQLWDATGKPIGEPMVHSQNVVRAIFTSHNLRVITKTANSDLRTWDASTGKPLGPSLPRPPGALLTEISGDGSRIVSLSKLSSSQPAAPASDGLQDGYTVQIWDAFTGKPLSQALPHRTHENFLTCALITADGKRIVTLPNDHTVRVVDADTGKTLHDFIMKGCWLGGLSPDGKRLVTHGAEGTTKMWDMETWEAVGAEHQWHEMVQVVFSNDSKRLILQEGRNSKVFAADSGEKIVEFTHPGVVNTVEFSRDGGRVLATVGKFKYQAWDLASGKAVGDALSDDAISINSSTRPLYNADASWVITSYRDASPKVFDTLTNKLLSEPIGPPGLSETGKVCRLSNDESDLFTVGNSCLTRHDARHLSHRPQPCPEWMRQFASAVVGWRFTDDGDLQAIPIEDRLAMLEKPIPDKGPWSDLAHWLVMPRQEQTVSPNSTSTFRKVAERERDTMLADTLRSALCYDPTVPLARLFLAKFEENPKRAQFLRDYELKHLPDDASLWARASKSLLEQQQPQAALDAAKKAVALDANLPAAKAALEEASKAKQ